MGGGSDWGGTCPAAPDFQGGCRRVGGIGEGTGTDDHGNPAVAFTERKWVSSGGETTSLREVIADGIGRCGKSATLDCRRKDLGGLVGKEGTRGRPMK